MTPFVSECVATALDILAFFFVTTELYGHQLDVAEAFVRDPRNEDAVKTVVDLMSRMTGIPSLFSQLILWVYRKFHTRTKLKPILLWWGAGFFLLARGLSLWQSARSG